MDTETLQLGVLAALKILKNLNSLDVDLTPLSIQLTSVSQQIAQIPTSDLSQVTTKLTAIENKLDLIQSSQPGLVFTPLSLNAATFTTASSDGWSVAPTNLPAITDGDSNTSTNLFEIYGSPYRWGDVIILPGITIPQYTRIEAKIGLQNSQNQQRIGAELAASKASDGTWSTTWYNYQPQSNVSDSISNIDIIIPFVWDKLKFRIMDVGFYAGRMRIYDLKVYAVS